MSKPKQPSIVTPVGVAKYANISKPKLNYNKTGEEYSVDLLFKPEDIAGFRNTLNQLAIDRKVDAISQAKNGREKKLIEGYKIYIPLAPELDKETGEETGMILLKAKNSASFEGRDGTTVKRSMPIFDAKGAVAKELNIGRGSSLKVSVVPNTFVNPATEKVGVSLWLKAVQVINLVEYGGGSADSFGFGEEEGFVLSEENDNAGVKPEENEEF